MHSPPELKVTFTNPVYTGYFSIITAAYLLFREDVAPTVNSQIVLLRLDPSFCHVLSNLGTPFSCTPCISPDALLFVNFDLSFSFSITDARTTYSF